jgi:DNA invertase Pin-like site-specific DNA recombinase
MMTSKAVGYTRLSQSSDTSIEDQKAAIAEYCDQLGLELLRIYDDGEGSSGFDTERPEYAKVRELMRDGEVGAVVVRDRSRLGRDFDERMQFVLDLRRTNVSLHASREGEVDLNDPYAVVMESMRAATDDAGARENIEKAKKKVAERVENGYYQGRPPFGTRFSEDKTRLVPDEGFETVVEVLDMLDGGMTYRSINEDTGVSLGSIKRIKDRRDMYEEMMEEAELR